MLEKFKVIRKTRGNKIMSFTTLFFLIFLIGMALLITGFIIKKAFLKVVGVLLSVGAVILFLAIAMFGC